MPRRLLRDGRVVTDDWQYLTELEAAEGAEAGIDPGTALIVPLARYSTERARWADHAGRLGIVLQPADKVEQVGDIGRFALIAAEFPGPTDGRGYTQGRLLRERYGFAGELRAAGYVRRDQLFFLARCGFNSFQVPESEITDAIAAFSTFSAEYQPANDKGLGHTLQHK